ncbi:MAG: ABC transporter permease, partial [Spirochaetales bacterium]|nr:ABC transporter permease [Spirochaetales bacterium]
SIVCSFFTFFFENIIEDILHKQSDMYARSYTGHFIITNKRNNLEMSFGLYPFNPEFFLKKNEILSIKAFLNTVDNIDGFEERIVLHGLYLTEDLHEKSFVGVAIDIENYNKNFTDLYLDKGVRVKRHEKNVLAASWFNYEKWKNVDIGKTYIFLLPDSTLEYTDHYFKVKSGISYKSLPKETVGRDCLYFDIYAYRELMGIEENASSDLIGFFEDPEKEAVTIKAIGEFLGVNYPDLKVVSWKSYAPLFGEIVFGVNVVIRFIEFIFIFSSILIVFKITLFLIMERFNEIGILKAIGYPMWKIIYLFTLENFLINISGIVIGFGISMVVLMILGTTGITNSLSFLDYIIGRSLYPGIHCVKTGVIFMIFTIITILSPMVPSIYGIRRSIADMVKRK